MLNLKDIFSQTPVVLAPMAGVTDAPFRLVLRNYHKGLSCAEMISSQSLVRCKSKKLYEDMVVSGDVPCSYQLLGRDPSMMADAARLLEQMGAAVIDINMGCSVRKVLRQKEGGALLREPELAEKIMKAVAGAVKVPVTVKIRRGPADQPDRALEMAQRALESGMQAIAVHGRTVEQGYAGKADWNIVAAVKKSVSLPVIGNGDIKSAQEGLRRLRETGCDAVMIGRAALGSPWLLRETALLIQGAPEADVSTEEKFASACKQMDLARKLQGERTAFKRIRKHLTWYIKGMPMASTVRNRIFRTENFPEILELWEFYRNFVSHMEKLDYIPDGYMEKELDRFTEKIYR